MQPVLIEDSIKTLNVSNGPVKYQDAIQATKVRLNLAVARGVLLLPARMIINTESIVGYNNNLRRSTDDMKLGVNNQVNQDTKKASLKLMEGGPSKINPPNSHPSNPIHKQATEAQGIGKTKTRTTLHTNTKAIATCHTTRAKAWVCWHSFLWDLILRRGWSWIVVFLSFRVNKPHQYMQMNNWNFSCTRLYDLILFRK